MSPCIEVYLIVLRRYDGLKIWLCISFSGKATQIFACQSESAFLGWFHPGAPAEVSPELVLEFSVSGVQEYHSIGASSYSVLGAHFSYQQLQKGEMICMEKQS